MCVCVFVSITWVKYIISHYASKNDIVPYQCVSHVHLCVYVHIHVSICVYVCVRACVRVCVRVCMHAHSCVHGHVRVCAYVDVYIFFSDAYLNLQSYI